MIKVSVEVRSGATRFRVALQAESIERAVKLVRERFPNHHTMLSFPIEPQSFFVEGCVTQALEFEQPKKLAA
jgi:hypothetical protein